MQPVLCLAEWTGLSRQNRYAVDFVGFFLVFTPTEVWKSVPLCCDTEIIATCEQVQTVKAFA